MFNSLAKDIKYLIFGYLDKIDLRSFSLSSRQSHSSVKDYTATVTVEHQQLAQLLLQQSKDLNMNSNSYISDSTQLKRNLRRFLDLSFQLLPDLDISLFSPESFKEVLENYRILNMTTNLYGMYHTIARNLETRGDPDDWEMKELLTNYQTPLQLAAKKRSQNIREHKEKVIVEAMIEQLGVELRPLFND